MRFPLGGNYPLDRRTFLVAGALPFFGSNLATASAEAGASTGRRTAGG